MPLLTFSKNKRTAASSNVSISCGVRNKSNGCSGSRKTASNSSSLIKFSVKSRQSPSTSNKGMRSSGNWSKTGSIGNSIGCRPKRRWSESNASAINYGGSKVSINSNDNNKSIISEISYAGIKSSRTWTDYDSNNSNGRMSFMA